MTLPVGDGGSTAAMRAAQEQARLAALEQQRAADAARLAHHTGEQVDPASKDNTAVIEKDTFVNDAKVGDSTAEQRQAVYDKFNTDGQDGLSDAEFDAAFTHLESGEVPPADGQAPPDDGSTYSVKPGDSLSKISGEKGGDSNKWKELYEANKDTIGPDPNMIQPGQQLKIPASWREKPETTEAKQSIDQAGINPDKPTHQVPDRAEEMQAQDRTNDVKTVNDAQSALEKIPADDPHRGDYEQKVQSLEDGFQQKWGQSSTQAGAEDTITGAKIDPQVPTHQVPDRAEELQASAKQADQQTIADAEGALKQIPPEQRDAYQQKVDQLKSDFNKKWNPAPADPNDPKTKIDNAKLPPPVYGPFKPEYLDKLKGDDFKILKDAVANLGQVPAAERAPYEQKVADLRMAYEKKWNECPAV